MNPTRGASIYASLIGLTLMALAIWKPTWAVGKGGYRDTWRTMDKVQHFIISLILCVLAMSVLNVDPWFAFVLTFLAGFGFEIVEGAPMWRDLVADGLGALVPVLWKLYLL